MTSASPSTPAKVSASAASYTPATLDPHLRSDLNSVLIREGQVTKIQDHLLHALHAHPNNWPTAIQTHALTLLRSGEVTTFPALLRRVMDDVRQDAALASTGGESVNGTANGSANGDSGGGGGGERSAGGLAVPQAVVDEALKVTRESLEGCCTIENGGAT